MTQAFLFFKKGNDVVEMMCALTRTTVHIFQIPNILTPQIPNILTPQTPKYHKTAPIRNVMHFPSIFSQHIFECSTVKGC